MNFQFAITCWFAVGFMNALGQNPKQCSDYVTAENVEETGLFELYTFEVEEGPLKKTNKLIGEITWILDNSTTAFSFDELFFNGSYNRKTKPKPSLFNIIFGNFTINETTPATTVTTQLATTTVPSIVQKIASDVFPNIPWSDIFSGFGESECNKAQIFQINALDREESDIHYLTFSDKSTYLFPVVQIKVTDVNDNIPVFAKESLSARITKNVKNGAIVARIKATDADIGKNADLRYDILNSTERWGNKTESPLTPTFVIHRKLGFVVLAGSLDNLEPNTNITFIVTVKDRGDEPNGHGAKALVTISIIDDARIPNDFPAETGQTPEPLKCGDHAADKNVEENGSFRIYTFEAEEGFLLIPRKIIGEISLSVENSTNSYSYDEPYFQKPYNTKTKPRPAYFDVVYGNITANGVTTTSSTPRSVTTSASPKEHLFSFVPGLKKSFMASSGEFGIENYTDHIMYNGTTQMTHVATTNVTPFSTTQQPDKPAYCVDVQIAQIFDLDREESDTHYLTLNSDRTDSLFTMIRIKVTDINDNSPVFVKESLSSRITKDVKYGNIVAMIKATDADIGKNADLRYSILYATERRGNATESPAFPTFIIHEKLGLVVLTASIDDLKPNTDITFNVIVKDRGDEYPANRATSTATITIIGDARVPSTTKVSVAVIAGSVVGGVVIIAIVAFVVFWFRKRHAARSQNGQLAFMLDDENLISA